MELQARTQKTEGHYAKGREVGSKGSRTPKSPYQWTWELWKEVQQTGDMQRFDWGGRETVWCFGMSGAEQGHTAISANLRPS